MLSVGTEDVKGNELTLEAFKLCKQIPCNFIGNVEGHDLFCQSSGCGGLRRFRGNVVLKTCESLAMSVFGWLKEELRRNPVRAAGAWLAREAFRSIKRRLDSDTYGGAPLLGLNGHVTIAHGSASERAIQNAIKYTSRAVRARVDQLIAREIAQANERLARPAGTPATS